MQAGGEVRGKAMSIAYPTGRWRTSQSLFVVPPSGGEGHNRLKAELRTKTAVLAVELTIALYPCQEPGILFSGSARMHPKGTHMTSLLVHGACPHDCPDTCGVITEVKDGRAVAFRGDPDHPITRGWLC